LTDFAQARLDMFESGLFGQGNAFWRWIATDEARPYLATFAADRALPVTANFSHSISPQRIYLIPITWPSWPSRSRRRTASCRRLQS
jgi:hypothetical protein